MKLKGSLLFLLVIISNVASWTFNVADLKIISEKKSDDKNKNSLDDSGKKDGKTDVMEEFKYANGFEYQSYKEMKVSNVILSGSVYLEGLSRSLMKYRQILENCGRNFSAPSNQTGQSNQTQLPETQSCATATKNGKLVQRLSELALETTRKLRDKSNEMNKDGQSEENELVLQLAWYLDQLARLTGYKHDVTTDIPSSTVKTLNTKAKDSSLELLETVENGRAMSKLPPKETVKSVVKRSTPTEVVNYYSKYKIWTGSNSIDSNSNYDVSNDLKVKPISKRSIPNKKYVYLRVSKKKMSKLMNISKLLSKPNVVKVVVIKKIKN